MIIIMLGAPASGKGSVSEILAKELNIPTVSSGDIFRKHISEGTEIGKKLNEYVTKGELVPDSIVLEMLEARLDEADAKDGVILDGFVRTIPQAEALDKMLEARNQKIDAVVNLETPTEEILERVTNRRICRKCKAVYNTVLHPSKVEGVCDNCGGELYQRDDDTLEKAKNRLEVYYRETAPLTEYYKNTGVLYSTTLSVAINRMKDEVAQDVLEYLRNK
ncbi:MAG: adenylate kinase [Clostridia bacterium]|nr:adenylate kinase [Clostridia bacterium]